MLKIVIVVKERRKKQLKTNNILQDQTHTYGRLEELYIQARTKEESTMKLRREFEKKRS